MSIYVDFFFSNFFFKFFLKSKWTGVVAKSKKFYFSPSFNQASNSLKNSFFVFSLVKRTIILAIIFLIFDNSGMLVNLGKTEVSFFFSLNFSLFWQKVLKIGLFFLEKRKVDFLHQNCQCFQAVFQQKVLENLTIFGQFFKRNSKESPIFFQNLQGFTLCFVPKVFKN